MKRLIAFLLTLSCMLLTLTACGENENTPAVTLDLEAEADAIIEKYALSGGTRYSSATQTLTEDEIRGYYGDATAMPDFDSVESYVVYIDETKPLTPCEFGIFKMKDGADADSFILFLQARINLKIENAKSYPSMDTSMLRSAKFVEEDGYIWYCAVKDGNEDINAKLESYFK